MKKYFVFGLLLVILVLFSGCTQTTGQASLPKTQTNGDTQTSANEQTIAKTCSQLGGYACKENEQCSAQILTASDVTTCCSAICTKITSQEQSSTVTCTDECNDDACEDLVFISCEEREDSCKYKIQKGKVLGKCGVECLSENDCIEENKECKENKCMDKPVEIGHAKSKPAPANTLIKTSFDYLFQDVEAEITLIGTIRGSAAWTKIKEANMFNDEASEGKEYLLAKVRFKLISASDDKAYGVSGYQFEGVSESGEVYDKPFIVAPEPSLSKDLYPGASIEGWVVLEINKSDSKPLLVFQRNDDGEIWFKLY